VYPETTWRSRCISLCWKKFFSTIKEAQTA
jgi:hypothetical protein